MEMRNRPFEFNILVVYLKWTKTVGTNCLLSIENKYQNIVLHFIHL
jgi:hypothetical protein